MAGGSLPLIVNPVDSSSALPTPFAAPRVFWKSRSCTATATGLAFGNYDPLSPSPATTSARFTVRCSRETNVTITFSTGRSPNYTTRHMKAGGQDSLDYNIYTDTTYSGIVGDGSGNSYYFYGDVGSGGGYADYYGMMPAGQNVGAGNYSDTITLSVTY